MTPQNQTLQLRPDQIDDLAKFIQFPRFLNRSGCGVGKTPVSCVYTEYEVNDNNEVVVWIQPSSLIGKNIDEVLKWTTIQPYQIGEIVGTPEKKLQVCRNPRIKVFFLTADSWASEYGDVIRRTHNPNVIICDEPHMYYRGWDSKRTKTFVKNLKPNTKIKFMTATPTPHGNLLAAYVYCHVLQQDYYKHVRYFKQIHAVEDEWGKIAGWQNHETLKTILDYYSVTRTAKDVYGEQEKFIVRRLVNMSQEQQQCYSQFNELGLLELKNSIISDRNVEGQNTLRLRQIMNSPHKIRMPCEWDDKGNVTAYEDTAVITNPDRLTPKEQELINYLNEGQRIAIFGVFESELNHILYVLTQAGFKGELINGTVSGTKRTQIDQDFRDDKLDFVVCSVKTAAVGFNWGFLNTIVFHSMDYGDDDFVQAYSRALRGVRENPLRIVILEYANSIEPVILWKVHNKSKHTNKVSPEFSVISFPNLDDSLVKKLIPEGIDELN